MRRTRKIVACFLCLVLLNVSAGAQEKHTVDAATLQRLIDQRLNEDDANRETIRRVLDLPEVREIARRFGLGLERAEAAVATLDATEELRHVAEQARQVERALAGGANVTISTTTIIIALLLLILIVVAVK